MRDLFRYIAIATLALTVGCDNTETPTTTPQPLQFSIAREGESTPAVQLSRADIREEAFIATDVIGIFGYTFDANWASVDWVDTAPDFIKHDKLSNNTEGYWTLGTPRYWPETLDPKLRTFAYYPYDADIVPSYTTGYPSIDYTVAAESRNQVDFMTSNPTELWTKESEFIRLNFKRALTRINFSVQQTGAKIEIIKIECPETNLSATGTFTDAGFDWSDLTSLSAVTAISDTEQAITAVNVKTQLDDDYTILLLPGQTIPAGSSFVLHYRNIYADSTTEERVATAIIQDDLSLVKGATYNIPFFIDNAYLFE